MPASPNASPRTPAHAQTQKNQTQEEREQKRLEKQAYLARKKKLYSLEETNYTRIVFMRATGNFWIIGGHSAIILANKIGPEVKLRVGVKRDTDFDYKFRDGIISFSNLDFYIDAVKKSAYIKGAPRQTADSVYFYLKDKVSETEYKLLLNSRELKQQKFEKMIIQSFPMPQVHQKVEEVFRTAFRLYKKYKDPDGRTILTEKFTDQMRIAHKMVLMIARGELDKPAGLTKISEILKRGMCDVMQIETLEIWSIGDSTAIAAQLISALSAIETEQKLFPTIAQSHKNS
ncbi:hypothetical protein IJ095_02115 [Candidatus Saccharibacteria bacterium]|nr:hypothetical protein [Candidatus Saccharibacteria bacterium]